MIIVIIENMLRMVYKNMKLLQMLNMTKSHILRIIFCSICTMGILLTVSTVNRVFTYIFLRWNLDIAVLEASVPFSVIVTVLIWNYVVGVTVACLLWKYLGLPKITVIGKIFKRFIDIYYTG